MMVPVGRLVILKSVPKHELVGSLAWLTVPALIGPVIGPPVGGFITTYFHWRWIFWINIPVGLLGLVLATLYIPEPARRDARPLRRTRLRAVRRRPRRLHDRLDLARPRPAAAVADARALPRRRAPARRSTCCTAGASPHPILDLSLFRIPTFALTHDRRDCSSASASARRPSCCRCFCRSASA